MSKKIGISVASLIMIMCFLVSAFSVSVSAESVQKINAAEVNIYTISDEYADVVTIPDEYPTQFTFEVEGADTVSVNGGYFLTVDGVTVSPRYITYYCYGPYTRSTKIYEGMNITGTVNVPVCGSYNVSVWADNVKYDVKVNVLDYAEIYVDNIMQEYIDKNMTDDMTTYEKTEKIAEFVCQLEYDVNNWQSTAMVIFGGGDCFASADTVVRMAKMIGLDGWGRSGFKDFGAGSNHKNAMVTDGEKYYMVEAGFSEDAPRRYVIDERDSLFSFRTSADLENYEVYNYDGKEMPDTLVIPETYKDSPVVSVGNGFTVDNSERVNTVKNIVLPETVTRIGRYAFADSESLEKVNIPSGVTFIGDYAFSNTAISEMYIPKTVTGISENAAEGAPDMTVYGFKGTDAETFASQNDSITFFDLSQIKGGDTNLNGTVDVVDCSIMQMYLSSAYDLNEAELLFSDVNENRITDVSDCSTVQMYLAGYDAEGITGQTLK